MVRELRCGSTVFCVDAPVFDDISNPGEPRTGTLGLLVSDLGTVAKRGQSVAIAQFYGLVLPGTILTRHVFAGLCRPMFTDGNDKADKANLVYTRKPAFDYVWSGTPTDGGLEQLDPPAGAVFALFVSPNIKHKEAIPEIDGWINYWTWVGEDQGLAEAPVDWVGRYDEKLWTRKA